MTNTGLKDLSTNLATAIQKASSKEESSQKCMAAAEIPIVIAGEDDVSGAKSTSWLGSTLAYMKKLFTFNVSIFERTSYFNLVLFWVIVVFAFFMCVILMVKCVYKVFKVKSEGERERSMRKRYSSERRLSL